MSRAKIGGVIAVVLAGLTASAALLARNRIEAAVRHDVEARVGRADRLLRQISVLESFDLIARAQLFARDENIRRSLADPAVRAEVGKQTVDRFLGSLGPGDARPDFVALVDAQGAVILADSPLPDSDDLRSRFKAVAAALETGQVSKDVWDYGKSTVRVGVAPVLDASGSPGGAVIVAYALNAKEAQAHAALLGADVVFFSGDRVVATSFKKQAVDDLGRLPELGKLAKGALDGARPAPVGVTVAGESYMAAAGALPLNFANRTTGAMVLASVDEARAPYGSVVAILIVLGVAALIVAILAMWITARIILHQADDLEAGVTEILHGDTGYVFKPVGADLDGLAGHLNQMVARLTGRPEVGGDTFDEPMPLPLAEDGMRMSQDADVVALASEPEPDYLRRVYAEFVAARRALGENMDGVTFDGFSAKLRSSEVAMRAKLGCKAVRFKVQTRGDQVSLKPVPIV